MLRTELCERMGIEHPVIQASLGPWTSVELSAAVSNAGGLGSIGTALKSPAEVEEMLARMRAMTDRPFAVNHTMRPFSEEVFARSLEARPAVTSMALGLSRDVVARAKDAGSLFMQQVHTVAQALAAAEAGVDVIVAQGGEAGGFGGSVGTMALVPQVVDAVSPIPVVAAGGIADGRGLAAALVLGAQGVNIGTRFLASEESQVGDDWKRAIVAAASEDAVKVEFAGDVFPPAGDGGYATLPRALRTSFIEEGNADREKVRRERERLSAEMVSAVREGRGHELIPFTGETAGMIADVRPAAGIVEGLVKEAEAVLGHAARVQVRR
jgi:enoyl-[acyl-carrier protein] reductase II